MAYRQEESNSSEQNPFWEHAGEYTSKNVDTEFHSEMAYMLVTLYKSEVQ